MALNGYGIYVTDYSNNQTVELPVNPSEVTLKLESDDKSQSVINLGEISQLGYIKLSSISIASVFPEKKERYVSSDDFKSPQEYIELFEDIQKKRHHVQLVIGGTKISLTMSISSFEYGLKKAYTEEYAYTLEFKEYREAKYEKINSPSKPAIKRPAPPKKMGVGSIVIVNGRLHSDSNGRGVGQYERNARRKITYLAPGHAYPVHVSLPNGGARGWVKQSEVRLA